MGIILQRQRALATTGEIRIGEKRKSARNTDYPAARDTFRFTSPNKAALEKLHAAYGGTLRPWADADHKGQFELLAEVNQISVIVDTTFSLDENFELYDGKTRTRFCDGETCVYLEIIRNSKKEIESCTDHGKVPCVCDPAGLGEELEDEDRECALITSLKVMIPVTADIVRWGFTSKGKIFNREVFGLMETLREMGMRQAFCLMTLEKIRKVRGNDVSAFPVVRLTLDPNPPDFVSALLANTPDAQARKVLEASRLQAPALNGPSAPALPQNADSEPPNDFGPTDPARRREVTGAAMQFLKEKKWTERAHQANMTAFKNACTRGRLWWPEVFVEAIDKRKTDWPEFIAYASDRAAAADKEREEAKRQQAEPVQSPFEEQPTLEAEFTEVR